MDGYGLAIENLFHEKLLLYQDLLDALEEEKQAIIDTDLEGLWRLTDQKQKLASSIASVRQKILDLLEEACIPHTMDAVYFQASKVLSLLPDTIAQRLRTTHVTLVTIKNDVNTRVIENKRYVEERLEVLDDLIGILTHAENREPVTEKDLV
jgi:flagellar biosynthesis/type III secretory pathway chaperone